MVREIGLEVGSLEDPEASLLIIDISGADPTEVATLVQDAQRLPTLVIGAELQLPELEAAVRAGALDLAVEPQATELRSRLSLLSFRADRQGWRVPDTPVTGEVLPRVLVIEDDPDIRELLRTLLGPSHDVLEAATGEEGLERARIERPDAILLDMVLPQMDGLRVLEELQRHRMTAEIPVLFLSAQRSEAMRVRTLEMGASDFIAKPFSAEELRARIAKTIGEARTRERLRRLAETDALTGLANFRALHARLEAELQRAKRYAHPLGLLMLDLDEMKAINDQQGHEAGNRAIAAVADAIRSELRQTDFAARFGGDEFVVLLPHSDTQEAQGIAERLRRAIRGTTVGDRSLRCSFGVSAYRPGDSVRGSELLEEADAALYQAKQQGRDRICVATPSAS